MIDKLDDLIGSDVSKAHLSWLHLNVNNTSIDLDELYQAYMVREPDLRGITIDKVEDFIKIVRRLIQSSKRSLTGREFMEKQYNEGKLLNLPGRQPLTAEEQAERERLAKVFAAGKPMSEMVIEDRGPR